MSEHPRCDCHDCTQDRAHGQFLNIVHPPVPLAGTTEPEKPDLKTAVLCWLGFWRDKMPPEAVSSLQDVCGVPSAATEPEKAQALDLRYTPAIQQAVARVKNIGGIYIQQDSKAGVVVPIGYTTAVDALMAEIEGGK